MTRAGLARWSSGSLALVMVGGLVALIVAFGAVGTGANWIATTISVALHWGAGGTLAGLYLAGAWGLGAGLLSRHRDEAWAAWTAPALGLGAMLTISHAFGAVGAFGWFGGAGGRAMAAAPIGLGVVLLARHLLAMRAGERAAGPALHPAALASLPALALLAVASCSPPGWLWASEGYGYDTLSYHLQLPAEWLALGRLWPVEHNVYSFLPNYVEAAFYHLLVLTQAHPASGGGAGVLAAQMLGALTAVLAAVLVGRVAWVVVSMLEEPLARARGSAAGVSTAVAAIVLGTPWMLVTGSLAYNEPAVVMLGAGAMLVALAQPLPPARRWMLAAFLVGCACGAKPTALFLVAPVVGALLLVTTPARAWLRCLALASAVGLASLLPWLVRNGIATGNPVFPQLPGLLGHGHWTPEQHARWAHGHAFDGSAIDRLRLLFWPDPGGPHLGGTSMRGLLHPQWGVLGAVALLAMLAAPLARRHRVVVALAVGLAVQLFAWMTLTHLQSRFLQPIVLAAGPLLAVSLVPLRRLGLWLSLALALAQVGMGAWVYASQRDGHAGAAIGPGVALFTGVLDPPASPQGVVNMDLPEPGGGVLLIGDAAPLYYTRGVLYTTTWDKGPLVRALEAHPGDADAQARALRSAGVRWLLMDEGELVRLSASGWLDPALTRQALGELVGTGTIVGHWPGAGGTVRILIDLGAPAPNPR